MLLLGKEYPHLSAFSASHVVTVLVSFLYLRQVELTKSESVGAIPGGSVTGRGSMYFDTRDTKIHGRIDQDILIDMIERIRNGFLASHNSCVSPRVKLDSRNPRTPLMYMSFYLGTDAMMGLGRDVLLLCCVLLYNVV